MEGTGFTKPLLSGWGLLFLSRRGLDEGPADPWTLPSMCGVSIMKQGARFSVFLLGGFLLFVVLLQAPGVAA